MRKSTNSGGGRKKPRGRQAKSNSSNPISSVVRAGASGRGVKVVAGADTFLSTLSGSVSYAAAQYSLNPGIEDRFPSLSKEAARFDQYKFESLKFRFVRSRAVTTTPGMVGLAIDPNPNTATPDNLATFNAYEVRKMESVYSDLTLDVPRAMLGGWRFTRCGPIGTDLSLYDLGSLITVTQDEDDGSKIGFLEVHYRVAFRYYHLEPSVPRLSHSLAIYSRFGIQQLESSSSFNIGWDEVVVDGLGIVNDIPTFSSFTLPCGQYLVSLTGCFETYSVDSSTAECSIIIRKDGVGSVIQGQTRVVMEGTLNQSIPFSCKRYMYSDGTDTVQVAADLTFTAGVGGHAGVSKCNLCIQALT